VLLLACGAMLGFAPAPRGVHLPSGVVLLLFLMALLPVSKVRDPADDARDTV
jgi:hypothetical protein